MENIAFEVEQGARRESQFSPTAEAVREAIATREVSRVSSRLARGVFAGRAAELAALRAAVDDVLTGRGRLVLLEGQPGIGKTTLARAVGAYAEAHSMDVVWGRCDGARVLRASLAGGFRSCAPVPRMARPAARGSRSAPRGPRSRQLPTWRSGCADRFLAGLWSIDRWRFRFFDGVALLLKNAARRRPMLVVLDDLHWADCSSLLLLQFVIRELSDSPVLVLCAYRDAELVANDVAAKGVAELRSEAATLHLRGLSENEVRAQIGAISCQRVPSVFARAIFRRTEGNPFFVEEILRHLLEEGIVYHDGDGWTSSIAPDEIPLPDSIRELGERRLGHVSETGRDLLSVAAVIGREFGLDVIEHLTGLAADRLWELLEEAVRARIIVRIPGPLCTYIFRLPMVREALYELLPARRRNELHRRVGEHLEHMGSAEVDLHAAELAYHFLHSASREGADKAIDYASRAAARAVALLAHEEAARYYELALRALEGGGADEAELRGRLLLKASESWWRAGESHRARRSALLAAGIYRARGMRADLARAALTYAGQLPGIGGALYDPNVVRVLEESLVALGEGESGLHARIMGRLAEEIRFSDEPERQRLLGRRALEMARRLGDAAVLAPVLKNMHSGLRMPEKVESRVALADEVLRLANVAGDDSLAFEGHLFHCFAKLELGDFPSASSALAACSRLAKSLKQPYLAWVTASAKVCFAFTQARLDEIETLVQKAFDVGEELQSPKVALFRDAQLAHLLWLRGRLDELTSLWQRLGREYPRLQPTLECAMAAVSGERGNEEEARARFELLAADGFVRLPRDGTWPQNMTFLAEACTLLRDEPRAARLYDLLRPLDGRFLVVVPILPWGAASHSLGRLAATMGRIDLAQRHFEDAMAVNASIGARHWLARTQMVYAEMLLDCGATSDRARAVTLLAQSAEISGGLGMDAFARRAQAMPSAHRGREMRRKHPAQSSMWEGTDRPVGLRKRIPLCVSLRARTVLDDCFRGSLVRAPRPEGAARAGLSAGQSKKISTSWSWFGWSSAPAWIWPRSRPRLRGNRTPCNAEEAWARCSTTGRSGNTGAKSPRSGSRSKRRRALTTAKGRALCGRA